jgi:hypothetical protein
VACVGSLFLSLTAAIAADAGIAQFGVIAYLVASWCPGRPEEIQQRESWPKDEWGALVWCLLLGWVALRRSDRTDISSQLKSEGNERSG